MNGFNEKEPISLFIQNHDVWQAVMLVEGKTKCFEAGKIHDKIILRGIAQIKNSGLPRETWQKLLDHSLLDLVMWASRELNLPTIGKLDFDHLHRHRALQPG